MSNDISKMSSGLQWNIHRFFLKCSLCNWSVIQKWLSIDTERVSPSPLTPRNCHCLQRAVEILTYFIMPTHCCQNVFYISETVIADFYFEHIIAQWFGSGYRSPNLFQYSYHKIKFFEVQVNMPHLFSFIFFSWTQTGACITGDTTCLRMHQRILLHL